jgi:alkylation response protein AidB-like acyl-CoA dehydrogenase
MNFTFSEDQQLLRDSVHKWVEKSYTFERRKNEVKAGGFAPHTWQELSDLGLNALYVPESLGGAGFGAVEGMIVMEELGRGLVLEPYAHCALMVPALIDAYGDPETKKTLLPSIASGEAIVSLAYQEKGSRYRLDHINTVANNENGYWQVTGEKQLVAVGDHAKQFIVSARTGADAASIALFLVAESASGVSVRGHALQDGSRMAELTLVNAPATLLVRTDGGNARGLEALRFAIDVGTAAICAGAVGAMDKLFALTVDYLNTRKQFGVAIGTFQALRHQVADVKMQLELARSMSYFASLKLTEDADTRRHSISLAKLQIGQSIRFVGQHCIQLHGGIGVTDEYIASHYFKHLTVLEMTFGDTLHHLGEVSQGMKDTAGVFA